MPVKKTNETKTVPQEIKPILDLSIDNIPVEHQQNNNELFLKEKEPTEENSALFETLSKDPSEPKIDLSAKLLTDEEKIENRQYLESVEGVQINIEGKFK